MSSPGYFMDDADWAKQRMAQALMTPQNNQGAYGGLANLGSSLGGAYAMKSMMPDPMAGQKARMAAAGTPMGSNGFLSNLFSLGGAA
jgi:hypothetical protein